MKLSNIKTWHTERISQRIFYLLIGLSLVVFLLFFLVGYDMPFEENPDFNAPLFTNLLLGLVWLLMALAVGAAIFSVIRSWRRSSSEPAVQNGISGKKIFRLTWGLTLLLLLVSFVLSSAAPILINGDEYKDWAWLKLSDMFVDTSLVMLVGAVLAVLYGATRYIRKGKV